MIKYLIAIVATLYFGATSLYADSWTTREQIFAEIDKNPSFGPYEIEIYARGGLVILDGKVASEYSRKTAEQIALQRGGVESVTNNLVVDPEKAKASEENAKENVAARAEAIRNGVSARKDLSGYDLVIRMRGSTAILLGSVRRSEDKEAIESIALRTPGVKEVSNQMEVHGAGVGH